MSMSKGIFNLSKALAQISRLSQVAMAKTYSSASKVNAASASTAVARSRDAEKSESTPSKEKLPDEVAFFHPGHNMYVCWHPEVPFPYEMSKPIPTETHLTESNLKIQSLVPVREIFRKKNDRMILRELMKLTYTPQYKWRGKYEGRKKREVLISMDPLKEKRNREYL